MTNNSVFLNAAIASLLVLTSACQSNEDDSKQRHSSANSVVEYTKDSWKSMVRQDCKKIFDGCNTCYRDAKSGQTRCTEKYCDVYQKPECRDTVNKE